MSSRHPCAGGRWNESQGVVFSSESAKALGEHLICIRWLPWHLLCSQSWTDSVQLVCDLRFLEARMEQAMLQQHIDDCSQVCAPQFTCCARAQEQILTQAAVDDGSQLARALETEILEYEALFRETDQRCSPVYICICICVCVYI